MKLSPRLVPVSLSCLVLVSATPTPASLQDDQGRYLGQHRPSVTQLGENRGQLYTPSGGHHPQQPQQYSTPGDAASFDTSRIQGYIPNGYNEFGKFIGATIPDQPPPRLKKEKTSPVRRLLKTLKSGKGSKNAEQGPPKNSRMDIEDGIPSSSSSESQGELDEDEDDRRSSAEGWIMVGEEQHDSTQGFHPPQQSQSQYLHRDLSHESQSQYIRARPGHYLSGTSSQVVPQNPQQHDPSDLYDRRPPHMRSKSTPKNHKHFSDNHHTSGSSHSPAAAQSQGDLSPTKSKVRFADTVQPLDHQDQSPPGHHAPHVLQWHNTQILPPHPFPALQQRGQYYQPSMQQHFTQQDSRGHPHRSAAATGYYRPDGQYGYWM